METVAGICLETLTAFEEIVVRARIRVMEHAGVPEPGYVLLWDAEVRPIVIIRAGLNRLERAGAIARAVGEFAEQTIGLEEAARRLSSWSRVAATLAVGLLGALWAIWRSCPL